MIKHILKTIWTEKKINAWILMELVLVFCILWFCSDYLTFMAKRSLETTGFDIEHTYRIDIDMKDEGREVMASGNQEGIQGMKDDIWTIYDRLKNYPALEYVSYSNSAYPYSGSWSSSSAMIDSIQVSFQYKTITPDFFNVFKINKISGILFTWDNIIDNPVIVSSGRNDLLGATPIERMEDIKYSEEEKEKILGAVNKSKRSEYEDYNPVIYRPMKKDHSWVHEFREICVRVKPDADVDFVNRFTKDMRGQLEVGPYFLSGVVPLQKLRSDYMNWNGYNDDFKSIYSITVFLIINIFLGVVGTFWFRIQSRRSEIGLRLALGASKTNVKNMFVRETLLLLFLASLVATVICVNISFADVLKDINVPVPDRGKEEVGIIQHLTNYGMTFISLAIISVLAVWYPAKKASDIQPTEALRDE